MSMTRLNNITASLLLCSKVHIFALIFRHQVTTDDSLLSAIVALVNQNYVDHFISFHRWSSYDIFRSTHVECMHTSNRI